MQQKSEHVQGFKQWIINCICYKEAEVPIIFFGVTWKYEGPFQD